MFNSSFIITTIFIISVMSILGIVAVFVYSFMKQEQESESEQERSSESYEKILKAADVKAESILDKTQETAAHILTDAKATNEHVAESLDRVLQLIAQKHIAQMNQMATELQKKQEASLSELKTKLEEQSKQTAQLTETRVAETLEVFTKSLMGKSVSGQEQIDQKTKVLLAQADKEIEEYKKSQLEKVQGLTQELLEKTYHNVLKRSLPEQVQGELIIEALEKAKEEGIFEL